MWHNQWRQIISKSQDILSGIFDVIQSEVALQKQSNRISNNKHIVHVTISQFYTHFANQNNEDPAEASWSGSILFFINTMNLW